MFISRNSFFLFYLEILSVRLSLPQCNKKYFCDQQWLPCRQLVNCSPYFMWLSSKWHSDCLPLKCFLHLAVCTHHSSETLPTSLASLPQSHLLVLPHQLDLLMWEWSELLTCPTVLQLPLPVRHLFLPGVHLCHPFHFLRSLSKCPHLHQAFTGHSIYIRIQSHQYPQLFSLFSCSP